MTLDDMVAQVQRACMLAAGRTRALVTNGQLHEYPDPDTRTMVEATRLIAQLNGYIGSKPIRPEQAAKEVEKMLKRAKGSDRK